MDHEHWIGVAIRLAEEAVERGDEPFGALLVLDGAPILEARNAIRTSGDVTQHAELRLVSKASRELAADVVGGATLYTRTEPCAMCCGAIYWAGIRHVVFGFSAVALEDMLGGVGIHRSSGEILGDATLPIHIEGPILADKGRKVHERYWVGGAGSGGDAVG
jgi:tRNA(Arg) A34 adenosine deaminase TadA